MPELSPLLERALDDLGIETVPTAAGKLLDFVRLLARWAPRMNLTGHRTEEEILRRLVLDAVALWQLLPRAAGVVDLGSGAGVPGLPMAILSPSVPVLLIEARLRRHHFQRAARRELGLENAHLRLGRIEALEPEPAGLVVAQAVAAPATVVSWMLPWAAPGGWLAIPGSAGAPGPRELDDRAAELLERESILTYRVPLEGPERTLWLARRRA
jgi:16S rRNA (guanine527-N7)-methyltransferase